MTTTDKRDIIPLIMWFVLFAGIALLTFLRIWRLFGIGQAYPVFGDVLFIGLYLLWMMIEFPVSKRDATTAGKTISDSMTCQLYGFGQALTILTALWYPSVWRGNHAAHYIGIGIFLVGVLYRLWAIHTLGRFYSHRVQTVSRH